MSFAAARRSTICWRSRPDAARLASLARGRARVTMRGLLIAFEGLDQSGKQTQAESLRDYFISRGRDCRLLSFPDYTTAIGSEISRALHGERDYPADTMQLLYVANRYEHRGAIESLLAEG